MKTVLENKIWSKRLLIGLSVFIVLGIGLFFLDEKTNVSKQIIDYLVYIWISLFALIFTIWVWAWRVWYKGKSLKQFLIFTVIAVVVIVSLIGLIAWRSFQANPLGV